MWEKDFNAEILNVSTTVPLEKGLKVAHKYRQFGKAQALTTVNAKIDGLKGALLWSCHL